ncbi:hypothetical protein [Halorussus sp. MSC15.2]|uniref:hypothetical protein n=1 Tax=Halorussus sp. MSC15.2 TaxID=2283638 RepID=UPI0013D66305|nr:hypothetical protein [Halorussus sp. MSC15.2]NEU55333.1 hypothetical protein [Halorussus sp. MSC15.2]
MEPNENVRPGLVSWRVDFDSWRPLRAFAYAKFGGVYGFLVFVLSNVPLLLLSPSSDRLVSESWRYVVLSGVSSLGIVGIVLTVYMFGGKRSLGQVVTVMGVDGKRVFDSIDIGRLSAAVVLGAWFAAASIAYVPDHILGTAVILVPILLKVADAVLSILVPLSGSVDVTSEMYRVGDSDRCYDLSTMNVLGAVEVGNVTMFPVRGETGPPRVLILPTELYRRLHES